MPAEASSMNAPRPSSISPVDVVSVPVIVTSDPAGADLAPAMLEVGSVSRGVDEVNGAGGIEHVGDELLEGVDVAVGDGTGSADNGWASGFGST
jgi:hypothetical protein